MTRKVESKKGCAALFFWVKEVLKLVVAFCGQNALRRLRPHLRLHLSGRHDPGGGAGHRLQEVKRRPVRHHRHPAQPPQSRGAIAPQAERTSQQL